MDIIDTNKIWAVLHKGPQVFLGCCCEFTDASKLGGVLDDMEEGKLLCLDPVIELMAPVQQVPTQDGKRVGVTRAPIPLPYGFTTGQAKLRLVPDAISFINEMNDSDKKLYFSFIESILKGQTEERAHRLGLSINASLNGGNRA